MDIRYLPKTIKVCDFGAQALTSNIIFTEKYLNISRRMIMKKNTTLGTAFIFIALVSLVFAIVCFNMEIGYEPWRETYGGDAYTGIQNAAADTARNIADTNNIIKTIAGFAFVIVGLAFGSVGIANFQENKKSVTTYAANSATTQQAPTPEKTEEQTTEHAEL